MSAAPMRLAALIVTHNRLAALKVTLERMLAEAVDRVLVVDNASDDGTAEWLAGQDDPRLEVLRLAQNRGGAGGFSAGVAAVLQGPGAADWCVLLDDDARPCPGAMAAFRRALADHDPGAAHRGALGAVAAAVILPDGRIAEMNRPGRNPFWHPGTLVRTLLLGSRRGFHVGDGDLAPGASPRPIDTASFVGFFLSRGAVARAGLPDADRFLYGDDVLYSLHLRRMGLGIRLMPAIRFEHDCATMEVGFVYRPLWKIYYHCRNGVGIARAAAGPVVFPLALAWYVAQWWRRGRHCRPEDRALYRRMMWAGLRDGLRGRHGRNPEIHRMVLEAIAESR